jgi:mRNA-degrading endonuclease RelE of RelBE toxin-antitoxin system
VTDKISKLLKRLPPIQVDLIESVMLRILANDLTGLDIKALKGHRELFRARVGKYRIVFRVQNGETPKVIAVTKRDEQTYRDF